MCSLICDACTKHSCMLLAKWLHTCQKLWIGGPAAKACHVSLIAMTTGIVPERVVKQLCNNRVNYYFAQINKTTVQMTDMFAEEYKHSQNAVFKVLGYTANADTFIPMIVESIRDSMKRSSFFGSGRSAGSGSYKLDKGDHRTVFHSVL